MLPRRPPEPLLDTNALARWVDPLPIPALAKPSGVRPSPAGSALANPARNVPYYRVAMQQFQAKVHRDMQPTTFWGYGGSCPGPTFEARKGEPILVEWANELPQQHFLPIDHTLHGAEADKPQVRTVVHLHGARTGPESDGLSGGLVCAWTLGHMPLSESAGGHEPLLPRPCDGNHAAERGRRIDGALPDPG